MRIREIRRSSVSLVECLRGRLEVRVFLEYIKGKEGSVWLGGEITVKHGWKLEVEIGSQWTTKRSAEPAETLGTPKNTIRRYHHVPKLIQISNNEQKPSEIDYPRNSRTHKYDY